MYEGQFVGSYLNVFVFGLNIIASLVESSRDIVPVSTKMCRVPILLTKFDTKKRIGNVLSKTDII